MKSPTNLWKCPACGEVVDYGEGDIWPSREGKTQCESTGKDVQMVKHESNN